MKINIEKIKQEKSIPELLEFSILNIDKPSGPTSFWVSDFVRKTLNAKKTSHAGTLDPQVSGVLPILLNRACRLSDYFMHKNKTYVGIMRVHEDVDDTRLKEEIKKFIGKIKQLPPVKSRVKREIREREIYSFNIIERDEKDNRNVLFETEVEAGTYIRKLIHNAGENIGGAHMLELRRVKAGIFSENDKSFVNLYDFEKAVHEYKEGNEQLLREMLIPAEIVTEIMPVVYVKEEAVKQLLTGKPIFKQDLVEDPEKLKIKEGNIAIFANERFIGIYNLIRKEEKEKEIVAKPEFVFN